MLSQSANQSVCLPTLVIGAGGGAFLHTLEDKHFYTGGSGNNDVDC